MSEHRHTTDQHGGHTPGDHRDMAHGGAANHAEPGHRGRGPGQ